MCTGSERYRTNNRHCQARQIHPALVQPLAPAVVRKTINGETAPETDEETEKEQEERKEEKSRSGNVSGSRKQSTGKNNSGPGGRSAFSSVSNAARRRTLRRSPKLQKSVSEPASYRQPPVKPECFSRRFVTQPHRRICKTANWKRLA